MKLLLSVIATFGVLAGGASLHAAVPGMPSGVQAEAAAGQPAAEQNVTGTWKGSFDFQGAQVPVTLELKDAGESVTGTVTGMLQDAPTKSLELQDGKLQGDKLSFWLNVEYQSETYKIVYTGTVSGDKIQFIFGTDDGSWSADMTATRAPAPGSEGTAGGN